MRSDKNKPSCNIVLFGHLDCGKSTLLGSFLYSYGGVKKMNMEEFKAI